ncbi:TIGR02594 family protein [Achromobacter sp. RTa]|uniref:TIGR02594 family protein n=1 Tax=Achromobacter sp. RTa TaxID=1532557 RepID=UPI0018CFC8A4|nr:TIGR02594 family protein [Achromobacter sp. RTa]
MHRRAVLGGGMGALAIAVGGWRPAMASPPGVGIEEPVLFPEGKPVPTVEQILASLPRFQGGHPAYAKEIEKGRRIMEGCARDVAPMAVAQYFATLCGGALNEEYGDDAHLYAQEWPVRANPVIVDFFNATSTRVPNGDVTPWCAAFVNWCLWRSGAVDGTNSAASSSFRSWKLATTEPRPGDIVVFQHKHDAWKGHVGFFISRTAGGTYVLGGNQMPLRRDLPPGTYEARNTGEVNVKLLPDNGKDLKLHSFRTVDGLRGG